jgi:hypothetical protein
MKCKDFSVYGKPTRKNNLTWSGTQEKDRQKKVFKLKFAKIAPKRRNTGLKYSTLESDYIWQHLIKKFTYVTYHRKKAMKL